MRNTRFIDITNEIMDYDPNEIPEDPIKRKLTVIYKDQQGMTKDNVDVFFDELKAFMKEKMLK